jgi:hypothetical protein
MTATAPQPAREARYGRYYQEAPTLQTPDGAAHWITRSANFVVAASQVRAGTVLARTEQADEYMLLLPEDIGALIEAGHESVTSAGDSLTIVPPGPTWQPTSWRPPAIALITSTEPRMSRRWCRGLSRWGGGSCVITRWPTTCAPTTACACFAAAI